MRKYNYFIILSLLLSIISLVISFLRIDIYITNDTYISLVFTLIGVCVTIMVGYQIYNTIDSRKSIEAYKEEVKKDLNKTIDRYNENIKKLDERCDRALFDIAEVFYQTTNTMANVEKNEKQDIFSILTFLIGISSIIKSYNRCSDSIVKDSFTKWVKNRIEVFAVNVKIACLYINDDLKKSNRRNNLDEESFKKFKDIINEVSYSILAQLNNTQGLEDSVNQFKKSIEVINTTISNFERKTFLNNYDTDYTEV